MKLLVNIMIGKWSVPECTGTAPPPCAAFSFNKIDRQRALLFGGRQREARVNELHILNMDHWVSTLSKLPLLCDNIWDTKF